MKGGSEKQLQLKWKIKLKKDLEEFRDSNRADIIAHTLQGNADSKFFAEVLNAHFDDTFDRIESLDDSDDYKFKMINHLSDIHTAMKGRLDSYEINQESEKNSNIGMFQDFEERLNLVLVNAGKLVLDNTTHESSLKVKLIHNIKNVTILKNTIENNQNLSYYSRIAASAYLKAYFSELKSIKLAIKDGKPIKSNVEGLRMLFDSLSDEYKKKFERFNPNKSADLISQNSNTDIKEMISISIDQILQDLSKSINDFNSSQRNEKSSKQSSAKKNVQNNNLNNNSSINRTKNLSKQKPNSSNNRASNPIGEGFAKGVNRVVGENTKNINTSPTDSNSIKPLEINAKSEETKNATSTQNNVIINNQNNTEENNMRSSGNLTQEQFKQKLLMPLSQDAVSSDETNAISINSIKRTIDENRNQDYFPQSLEDVKTQYENFTNSYLSNNGVKLGIGGGGSSSSQNDEVKSEPRLNLVISITELINNELKSIAPQKEQPEETIDISKTLTSEQLRVKLEQLTNIALSNADEEKKIEAVSQINDYVNHYVDKGIDFVQVISDATQSLVALRNSLTEVKGNGKSKGKAKEGENPLLDTLDQLIKDLDNLLKSQELNQSNDVNSINDPSIQPTATAELQSKLGGSPVPLRSTAAQIPVVGNTATNARAPQRRNRPSASQTLIDKTDIPNKTDSSNVTSSQTTNTATREQNIGSAQTSASQAQTSSAQTINTTSQSQVIDSAQSQQTRDLASTNAQINQTNVNLDNQSLNTGSQTNSQQPIDNSSDEDFSLTLNGDKLFDSENINNQSLSKGFSQQQRIYDPSIDDDNYEDLSDEERTDSASVTNQKSGQLKPRNLINLNSSDDEFEEQSNQVNELDLQLSEDELEALNGSEEFEDLRVDHSERNNLREDLSSQTQRSTLLEDDSEVGQIIKKSKEYYNEVGSNNRSFLKVKQLLTKEPNEPEQDLKYSDTDDERKERIRDQFLSRLKAPNTYTDNNSEDSLNYAKILSNIYEGGGDTLKKAIDKRVNSIYESVWNESNKSPKVNDKALNDRIDQEVEQVLLQAYLTKYSYLGVRGRNADSFKPDSEETKILKNKAVDAYNKGDITSNDIKEAFKFEGMKWYSARSIGRKVTQPLFFAFDAPFNVANKIARNPVRVGMTLTAGVLVASMFVPGAFPLVFAIVVSMWAGAGVIKAVDAMMKSKITKPLFLIPAGILELVAVGIPKGIAVALDFVLSRGSRLLRWLGIKSIDPIEPFIKKNLDKVMPKLGDGVEFVKNYDGKKKETPTKNFLEGKSYADEQKAIQQKRSDIVTSLKNLTHHKDIIRAMKDPNVKAIINNDPALSRELYKNITTSLKSLKHPDDIMKAYHDREVFEIVKGDKALKDDLNKNINAFKDNQQAANNPQPAANVPNAIPNAPVPPQTTPPKKWPEVARDKISGIASSVRNGAGNAAGSIKTRASDLYNKLTGNSTAQPVINPQTPVNPNNISSPQTPGSHSQPRTYIPADLSGPAVKLPADLLEDMRSTNVQTQSPRIDNVSELNQNDHAIMVDAVKGINEGSSKDIVGGRRRSSSMGDIPKDNSIVGGGSSSTRSDTFRQKVSRDVQGQNIRG